MVTININREPVEVHLVGAFSTVGLTLRRLTSPDFHQAGAKALSVVNDGRRLETVMAANGLMPEGGIPAWRAMKDDDPIACGAVVTGVASWLAAVECAERASRLETKLQHPSRARQLRV